MPTVTYHGGPLLAQIDVVSVYLNVSFLNDGDNARRDQLPVMDIPLADWTSDAALQQLIPRLDGYLTTLVDSPYLDVLAEYSTNGFQIGRGTHSTPPLFLAVDKVPVTLPEFGTDAYLLLSDDTFQQLLITALLDGRLPPPTPNRCYFVFTPPGAVLENIFRPADGFHRSFPLTMPTGTTSTIYSS